MRFSLFTFFSVSRHMPGPKVCVSHYSRFSVFLAIFQVLQCVLFIFHVFQCFFFFFFFFFLKSSCGKRVGVGFLLGCFFIFNL